MRYRLILTLAAASICLLPITATADDSTAKDTAKPAAKAGKTTAKGKAADKPAKPESAPAKADETAAPAKAADSAAGQDTKTESTPVPGIEYDSVVLPLGPRELSVSGNRSKFEQYGTPPTGFLSPHLFVFGGGTGARFLTDLTQVGMADNKLFLEFWSPYIRRMRLVSSDWRGHPFLNDLALNRSNHALDLEVPFGRVASMQVSYSDMRYRPSVDTTYPGRPFLQYPDYGSERAGVNWIFPVGKLDIRLSNAVTTLTDYTGYQPHSTSRENGAEVTASITPNVGANLSYTETSTNLASLGTALDSAIGHNVKEQVTRAELQGTVGDSVTLKAYMSKTNNDRGFSESAYARNISAGGVRAAWSGIPGLFVRAGVDTRSVDYLSADRSTTVSPKVDSHWVTARYRPKKLKMLELTTRLSEQNRSSLPNPFFTSPLITQAPLVPGRITRGEFGLNLTPQPTYGLSYKMVNERQDNSDRSVTTRIEMNDVVGWIQPTNRLTLTASVGEHAYRDLFLANYMSNAHVLSGGLTYSLGKGWTLDTFLSVANSSGATDVRERSLGVSTRFPMGRDVEGVLEYTAWRFDDRLDSSNNYRSDSFAFWWRRKF